MAVHHILADGREVESVKGRIISIKEFPELKQIFINVNRTLNERNDTKEEIGS